MPASFCIPATLTTWYVFHAPPSAAASQLQYPLSLWNGPLIKFLPRGGGFKIYNPPLSPETCLLAKTWGMGERQSIAQKGVRAIDARNSKLEMAQMLQKPVFALPGCLRMSVNTLSCDRGWLRGGGGVKNLSLDWSSLT